MKNKTPKISKALIALGFALIFLMSLSQSTIESSRQSTISLLSLFGGSLFSSERLTVEDKMKRLEVENHLLNRELDHLRELFYTELSIKQEKISGLLPKSGSSLTAWVVFRSPASWNSTLWINRGEKDNQVAGKTLIAKGSPVVYGKALIGIVEEVGKIRSRIRLITDKDLTPAVRAQRSGLKLAKGELHGSAQALWRKGGHILTGEGFNYDFPDTNGPARDLLTGKPIGVEGEAFPILKVGDLLITSGLDGLFPEGLEVAKVNKIFPLREGDYYYEIEAEPVIKDFDELKLVFVLPPLD